MAKRALASGLVIWIVGTIMFRVSGPGMIHAPGPRTALGFAIYFVASALLVRAVLWRMRVPPDARPTVVSLLILPTLLLDPFSTAYFPIAFPNLPAAAAPTFGGLMLISCAGAVVGAWMGRGS
jgi:Family of unknown function (DUF5367)